MRYPTQYENLVMDFAGVCDGCIGRPHCSGNHGPCLTAAEGLNASHITGIISPRDSNLHDWIADVGGVLDLDYRPTRRVEVALPRYVPVLERQARGLQLPPWPAYALHLHSVLTPKRLQLAACAEDLRAYFRVPHTTRFVLLCYGRDRLMEELWAMRDRAALIDKLSRAQFDLVLSPNFSVYASQPRMTHLFRIRMAHLFYREMLEAGIPVLPHVYFGTSEDITRWAEWFADSPTVTAAACNMQTVTDPGFREFILAGLQRIRALAGRPLRFIISGPSSAQRIRDVLSALGPDTIITNAKPHQTAAKHRLLARDGSQPYSDLCYSERLRRSLLSIDAFVSAALPAQ